MLFLIFLALLPLFSRIEFVARMHINIITIVHRISIRQAAMKVSSNCSWVACARNIQHTPFKFLYFPAPSFWGRGWIVTVQEVPEKWVKTAIRVCCFGCDGWPWLTYRKSCAKLWFPMALKSQAAEKVTLTFLGNFRRSPLFLGCQKIQPNMVSGVVENTCGDFFWKETSGELMIHHPLNQPGADEKHHPKKKCAAYLMS